MVFSSTVFLFLFLPAVIILYLLLSQKWKNILLLFSSLFFYAWGEYDLVAIMICSIVLNYYLALRIEKSASQPKHTLSYLWIGIALNLGILIYFKYFNFFQASLIDIGLTIDSDFKEIALPIGISFFTFQNISYLCDVYRKEVKAQTNILHLGLYISFFPQLIAGPIVRYSDIHQQIKHRETKVEDFYIGSMRFIKGLAKKVIIANQLGFFVDQAFAISAGNMNSSIAWLAITCYALQIYFDFSGYSDMAIGLGRIFGFRILENFNYPYIASSVRDFWRRWHISLSSWFRDYLYIPLGGNRKGAWRTYFNLVVVFFLTGLWHGASWQFVVWGLFHGFFIVLERSSNFKLPSGLKFLGHIYLLLVILVSWVFFRSPDLSYAIDYLQAMFSFSNKGDLSPLFYVNEYFLTVLFLGLFFSLPVREKIENMKLVADQIYLQVTRSGIYLLLFVYCAMELAQTTYNPFIYYRF